MQPSSKELPIIPLSALTARPPVPRRRADGRTPYHAVNRRRILCVFPRYTHSFGTFDHAFPLAGVRAFMPPQGILVIAAYLPEEWEVRLIDENLRPTTDEDFRWADAVFITGMHVQRSHVLEINERAHRFGKVTALGGPSASGCPEWYGAVDLLHIGELGDGTDALITRLDASVERPERQEVYATEQRVDLSDFPTPAYPLLNIGDYFLGSVQFSSGCPYLCEFCDIPELYGRNPRLKTPAQVLGELDRMIENGAAGAVYFVDDNFIGNRKATLELMRELARWQEERGYPLQFACEATLNIAEADEILALMREANFVTVFCGIETPEEHALEFMRKKQNLRQPILDAIAKLNSYGLEVVSGIIMGLDTDTPTTGQRIREFIEISGIPLLTINILHALPRTPLWRRLEQEGRLLDGAGRESNVEFLLPYEDVTRMWRETVTAAYQPEAVYARFARQARDTYANRKKFPFTKARLNLKNIRWALGILSRLFWRVGVLADYRQQFWKMALPALRRGEIERIIHVGMVAHHLILYARECASGGGERSFYNASEATEATAALSGV